MYLNLYAPLYATVRMGTVLMGSIGRPNLLPNRRIVSCVYTDGGYSGIACKSSVIAVTILRDVNNR